VLQPHHVIGMIGIGQLGLPIAVNLMRAGFRVVGFRRTDREAFSRAGGEALQSPAEVTREADVLLLCLPGEDAQAAVLHGADGVLQALAPGKIVIEMGTYTDPKTQSHSTTCSRATTTFPATAGIFSTAFPAFSSGITARPTRPLL